MAAGESRRSVRGAVGSKGRSDGVKFTPQSPATDLINPSVTRFAGIFRERSCMSKLPVHRAERAPRKVDQDVVEVMEPATPFFSFRYS